MNTEQAVLYSLAIGLKLPEKRVTKEPSLEKYLFFAINYNLVYYNIVPSPGSKRRSYGGKITSRSLCIYLYRKICYTGRTYTSEKSKKWEFKLRQFNRVLGSLTLSPEKHVHPPILLVGNKC